MEKSQFSPAVIRRRLELLDRFLEDEKLTDIIQKALEHGLEVYPCPLRNHDYVAGYKNQTLVIGDYICGVYRISAREHLPGKFSWGVRISVTHLRKLDFVLVIGTDIDSERRYFIFPAKKFRRYCHKRKSLSIHIPIGENSNEMGRKPRLDVYRYLDAWGLLQKSKTKEAIRRM